MWRDWQPVGLTMKHQESSQTKFLWTVALLELVMMALYTLLVRYDDSADPTKALASREARDEMRFFSTILLFLLLGSSVCLFMALSCPHDKKLRLRYAAQLPTTNVKYKNKKSHKSNNKAKIFGFFF